MIEAVYPGSASLYLDLGTFYDAGALEKELDNIVDLNSRYKRLYKRAYDCIAAAANVSQKSLPDLWGAAEQEKMRRKLSGLASREFRAGGSGLPAKDRFLSAISCKGRIFFQDTVNALCERVCTLDNELGMAHFYLSGIAGLAAENGIQAVLCHDPLDPELLEAVLLPEISLGFIAINGKFKYEGEVYRHIRLDAIADKAVIAALRPELRHARKLSCELLELGMDTLAQAKKLHDELEDIYNPHVDFDGLYAVANDHISWLLDPA